MAVAYAHVNHVEANVIDMSGNVGPGAYVAYSAVVVSTGNAVPTASQQFEVLQRRVAINFAAVVTPASIQAQILADIQGLWADATITVVMI